MSRIIATSDGWHPQTQQDRDAILRELQKILASPHFCNSKRYPALLKYIVENKLAGKSELLKERTLGVEVFDRPATYDTNADTVVRYTAGEVRKRLMLFYHEDGRDSEIRIFLPAGSYIPDFLHGQERAAETDIGGAYEAKHLLSTEGTKDGGSALVEPGLADMLTRPPAIAGSASLGRRGFFIVLPWAIVTVLVVTAAVVGYMWKIRSSHPATAVDEFWAPVLHDQRQVVICTGGVLFAQNPFSGVLTPGANGDVEYPFVSMQMAAAIAEIEETMDSTGAKTQLIAAPWSSLTDLREHSVTLLGAFNNQWTMRLTAPLRYHFAPSPVNRIVDAMHSHADWKRDDSIPYSSADDYALVARYRDPTIDGWVVVLGGIGRNGTEAAAQFATSPHYLQLLKDQLGSGFGNRNIEIILKVSVIEAKTGAPSIVAVHTW